MTLRELKIKGNINKLSEEEILRLLEVFWSRLIAQQDKFDKIELFRFLHYCIKISVMFIEEKDLHLYTHLTIINMFKSISDSDDIKNKRKSLQELVLRFRNII